MKTTAEMVKEYFSAPADVKEFLAQKYDGILPIDTSEPKKPRKLFNNDFAKMAKVEENLENVLNRYSELTSDLYIRIGDEFVNLYDLLVEEGDGEFDFVTNFVNPSDLYEILQNENQNPHFESCPEVFRKLHFLENRREEILAKREKLMDEYGEDYCFCASLFTSYTKINPKTKKSA